MKLYLYIFTLIFSIIIYFATKWKEITELKSIKEGLMNTPQENIIFNSLNGIISHIIPHKYRTPFLDWKQVIPEAKILIDNFEVIKKECNEIMKDYDSIPEFDKIDKNQSPLANFDSKKWKTFFFKFHGEYNNKNCNKCPQTANLLRKLPIDLAMFSVLEKGKVLFPHRGPWKGILRLHLGITIPREAKISVNNINYFWKEGELVLFDDTYLHYATNPNDRRVILFMDIKRNHIPEIFHIIALMNAKKYIEDVNKNIKNT